MIRVLHIIHRYRGNYELLNLQASLDPARFQTIVCYLSGDPDGQNRLEEVAQKVIYLSGPGRSLRWYNLPLIWRLKGIIDEEQIHIVNCQQHRSTPVGVLAGLLAKARPVLISTLHGLGTARTWQRRLLNRLLHRHLFRIVGISEGVTKDILVSNPGLPPDKVATIQNGLAYEPFLADMEPLVAKSEVLPAQKDLFWFGTAGRLSPVKNQKILLEAFADIAPSAHDAVLVIAGSGELERDLRETARSRNIEDRVFFLGFRRDIPLLLQAFDVFLLPSLREGLPLALLEAMASARPAVVSRVGGIPEVIGGSECAFLVDPGDRDAIGAALLRMRRISAEQRQRMGERARERALSRFSAMRMIGDYENLYAVAFRRWEEMKTAGTEG